MGNRAFLMPGQGSQYVGMLTKLLPFESAHKVLGQINDILGFDIIGLMTTGPVEKLTQTENAQPALVACSAAWLQVLKDNGISCNFVLGHSLGEYSALYCAGAIKLETALKLVRRRGELMRDAVVKTPGTMGAIIGLTADKVREICSQVSEIGVCEPANFNSSNQIVVSGQVEAVTKAMEIAKTEKARFAKLLNVSAPFHSSLMNPVAKEFAQHIEQARIDDAKFPVIANVSAKPMQNADEIRQNLINQINNPVLWEKSIIQSVAFGVDEFLEVGAKNVLTGLCKQIIPNLQATSVEEMFL